MLNESLPALDDLGAYDPARLCPMLAGPALIDGDSLTVRLAGGDVSVHASRRLLRRVFALCDGTRSIEELLDTIPDADERDQLGRFFDFLLESGALVDACHYSLTATSYAAGHSPFGQAADQDVSDRIARRFRAAEFDSSMSSQVHPVEPLKMSAAFSARKSTYTFDERPVDLCDLNRLMWSMAGVVDEHRERDGVLQPKRTIPSAGGMHLVELYLALQRTVGDPDSGGLLPGFYRIRYPGEHRIQYELLGGELALLPRAVAKPGCLSYSTGVVFLAADARMAGMRYRNRAVQYLFTEAGMALQNGALAATELDFGFVSFGSYYEPIVKQLFDRPDHLVLGSALFGPMPTSEQVRQLSHCPPLRFAWADAPSELFTLPFFGGRASREAGFSNRSTWGRDKDPSLAYRKAVAESIERQGYCEPRRLSAGTWQDVPAALDPRQIARFSAAQYRSPGFPFKPFNPDAIYLWAHGEDHATGRQVSVLADLVYAAAALEQECHYKATFWRSNSSGCAAGTTVQDARTAALLELVERDAFMRHWFRQVPGGAIVLDSLPHEFRQRVLAIEQTGFLLSVQHLPSPWAPVVFLFAKDEMRRSACVSAGAGLDLASALQSALVEMETRVFSICNGIHIRALSPQGIESPDDHFGLYTKPAYFLRADRLFSPTSQCRFDELCKADPGEAGALFDRFVTNGVSLTFLDLTPRLNGVRDGRERLAAARAFAPGLLPMSFGYGMEPRGMVERIHPASRFPHPFP